jgi:hypothetical protein
MTLPNLRKHIFRTKSKIPAHPADDQHDKIFPIAPRTPSCPDPRLPFPTLYMVIFKVIKGGYSGFYEVRPEYWKNPVFCQDPIFEKIFFQFFRKTGNVFPLLLAGFETSTGYNSGVAGNDFVTG